MKSNIDRRRVNCPYGVYVKCTCITPGKKPNLKVVKYINYQPIRCNLRESYSVTHMNYLGTDNKIDLPPVTPYTQSKSLKSYTTVLLGFQIRFLFESWI